METYEILSRISVICFVIAGVMFSCACILWVVFKIPVVIGNLTGRTARASIARIRKVNEERGGQGYKPSVINVSRGKLTGPMQGSPNAVGKQEAPRPEETAVPETGLISANRAEQRQSSRTELLTDVLADASKTELLNEDENTTVLQEPVNGAREELKMLDEIVLIHTKEVIR